MPYKDPEKKREADRKWREANREKKREADRKWREANPEKNREYFRKWREANRAYCSLREQERNMRNRERHNELHRRSYYRRKAAAQAEWNEIMAEIQGASNV